MNKKEIIIYSAIVFLVLVLIFGVVFAFVSNKSKAPISIDSSEVLKVTVPINEKETNELNMHTSKVTFDSIVFDKESYLQDSAARATMDISFEGEPFYALIILKMSREGYSGYRGDYIYSNYYKTLIDNNKSLNKPVAFSYNNTIIDWPSETSVFEDKGKYNYDFLLFDCKDIQAEFNKECDEIKFGTDTFDDGFPSQEPLSRMSKSIEVK